MSLIIRFRKSQKLRRHTNTGPYTDRCLAERDGNELISLHTCCAQVHHHTYAPSCLVHIHKATRHRYFINHPTGTITYRFPVACCPLRLHTSKRGKTRKPVLISAPKRYATFFNQRLEVTGKRVDEEGDRSSRKFLKSWKMKVFT